MRKICVVTGTRAEYGLMSRLIRLIDESAETQLQIIATNMHLSPKYGNTYQEIERDGFNIDKKIPILEDGKDTAKDTVLSMSKALAGFAEAYDELRYWPQLRLLLSKGSPLPIFTEVKSLKGPMMTLYGIQLPR